MGRLRAASLPTKKKMKKYIAPAISTEEIGLTSMIATSPNFVTDPDYETPGEGSESEKDLEGGPGHDAEGY